MDTTTPLGPGAEDVPSAAEPPATLEADPGTDDLEPAPAATTDPEVRDSTAPSLVVGIGASAGGLDALQRLVSDLTPGSGFAYVVVQHLSPDHPSLMVEILERHTVLPVERISDRSPLVADTVYVLPPRTELRVAAGLLLLNERSGVVTTPIDRFLTSLAEDQGPRAVAVVLSGTGSDGSRGLRDVAAAGGLVIAQDPGSAAFDGMPQAAIATGHVDLILEPEQMGAALREHADHPGSSHAAVASTLPGEELGALLSLLKQHTGTDFSLYKRPTILRRIERRISALETDGLAGYLAIVRTSPTELTTLRRELLIGVTRFLRDEEAFEALSGRTFDELLELGDTDEPLRVWVAGCSTGEEAYTLAILLDEARRRNESTREIRVFATDIDRDAINAASRGVYPRDAVEVLGEERIERYFQPQGDEVTVDRTLRQMVVFAAHDLTKDPPFTRLAMVSCRNLLIYLQPTLQQRVMGLLHFALDPRGLLFLGPSETLGDYATEFETLDRRWKLYRRTGTRRERLPAELRPPRLGVIGAMGDGSGGGGPAATLLPDDRTIDDVYRTLVDDYVPPCLLVTENLQLVHVFGDAHRFLSVPTGAATLDLMRMLPPTSGTLIRAAVHRALRTEKEMRYTGVFDATSDGPADIRVRPYTDQRDSTRYALVFIELPTRTGSIDGTDAPVEHVDTLGVDVRDHIDQLERELQDTRETLQATVEELETSNEELQATNEELLASNEELQATNEELQSVNEELHTVNAEYQDKIDELVTANADLDHLFVNTHVGVVFVDEQLRVRKFTSGLHDLVNLKHRDIGRHLGDITHRLELDDLVERLAAAITAQTDQEFTTSSVDGRILLARIWPYLDDQQRNRGAVLTLTDVTELQQARFRLQATLDSLPEHVCVLDEQGVITRVNQAWLGFAADNGGLLERVDVGTDYLEVVRESGRTEPGLAELADRIERVLTGDDDGFAHVYPCDDATTQRTFVMHVRPLRTHDGELQPGAVVSHVDVSHLTDDAIAVEQQR